MPTLQEIQQRNQALKAAQSAGAVEGQAPTKLASAIQTGVQSSAESAGVVAEVAPAVVEDEVDNERASKSLGVYRAMQLRKYFMGSKAIRPTQGYFYAESVVQLEHLNHFANLGKVEKVEDK